MLKNKFKIISILLILTFFILVPFAYADNEIDNTTSTENTNAENVKTNYKKSDVYLSGKDINIDYIVDGNLYVCADTVTINSQIGGDAFIFAKKIIVDKDAYIFNNLFALADSIEIKGLAYDVYSCSNEITLSGNIYRDIKVTANKITINGVIGRDAYVNCKNIAFNTEENSSNAKIYGNLSYSAPNEITIPNKVVVGDTKFTQSGFKNISPSQVIKNYLLSLCTFIVFVLLIYFVLSKCKSDFQKDDLKLNASSILKTFLLGFLAIVIIPIIAILLLITFIGSTAGLTLLTFYVLLIFISLAIFTITVNKYLCQRAKITKTPATIGMLIVSSLVVSIMTKTPYVGAVLYIIFFIFGFGIIIKNLLPKNEKQKAKNK